MIDQPTNPETPQALAALLRAGADGELSASDRACLDALIAADPELAARVDFDRGLRGACGKAMTTGGCPEALRQKVLAIAGESGSDAAPAPAAPVAGSTSPASAPHAAERMAEQTRRASFWSGSRGLMGIAAAMLMTVAGVLVWQSSGLSGPGGFGGGVVTPTSYRQQVAEFITKEHARTSSPAAAARKFVHTDPEEAQAWFVDTLGDGLTLIGLNQPVEAVTFKGAGKCGVPGWAYGKSAHMRIEVLSDTGEPITVSVFVTPPSESLPMETGKTYAIDMTACGIEGYSVLAWSDGVANYFLVADEGTNACGKTIKAAGRPEPSEKI